MFRCRRVDSARRMRFRPMILMAGFIGTGKSFPGDGYRGIEARLG